MKRTIRHGRIAECWKQEYGDIEKSVLTDN
jgi:hypothetical protein